MFQFSLPLDSDSNDVTRQNVEATPPDDVELAAFVRGKCFVVVEDDTLVAEAISKTLTGMGGKVNLFHKAELALSHLNINTADYFIADYMLGGSFNGIQFLNQVCLRLGKHVIGVIMTGDTSPNLVREVENCAWPILHKPVSIYKLIASIRSQTD